jgi:hypothetical protein
MEDLGSFPARASAPLVSKCPSVTFDPNNLRGPTFLKEVDDLLSPRLGNGG